MRTFLFFKLAVALVALTLFTPFAAAQDQKSSEKEQQLLAVLRSDDAGPGKALACKGLAVHGSAAAVPDLAKLLGDERLSSWARIALEVIPGPEADKALREAAASVQGRQLVGVLNSIGVRRDAQAVAVLFERLPAEDAEVASAAAVALGRIGNSAATDMLRKALPTSPPKVRSAVAEGCILCAEQLLAADKAGEAMEIYDEVRKADVPKARMHEATRGAILARKAEGVPLLIEQLTAKDRGALQVALSAARELPGKEVSVALASEVAKLPADRAALLLTALADRNDPAVLPAVIAAMKQGDSAVRIAAIGVLGRLGDASAVETLLQLAAADDSEVAEAANEALTGLAGEQVNAEIVKRLDGAPDKMLAVLIGLVGQRRIAASQPLVAALEHRDAAVRGAALTALGETIGADQLPVLIQQAIAAKHAADAPIALKALKAACVRMPDGDACAAQLTAALPKAPMAAKVALLETLGAMGGPKALDALVLAVKSDEDELRDTSSRLLGEWMSVDAGPKLLELSKTAPTDKYKIRALRGYIRLARQFTMPEAQRAEMCQSALAASNRADEQKLVLVILERYPSLPTLEVALKAMQSPAIAEEATRTALIVAQKTKDKDVAKAMLTKNGIKRVKLEIVKAEYGAGSTQKDVTDVLKRHADEYPLIVLPAASYTTNFGGDPLPGTPKQLKVEYRLDGKAGTATFAENAVIVLPTPKG